jgi:hypothetical protein
MNAGRREAGGPSPPVNPPKDVPAVRHTFQLRPARKTEQALGWQAPVLR